MKTPDFTTAGPHPGPLPLMRERELDTLLTLRAAPATHVTIRGLCKAFADQPLYSNFNLDLPRPRAPEAVSDPEFVRVKAHTLEVFRREMNA